MRPGVLDTNKLTDTQSPTEVTSLESLMDHIVLVLQGNCRQTEYTGGGKTAKCFGRTSLVSMD